MTVKVLVVDDHAVFREGLRTVLSGPTGIQVVGEASTGEEALEQVTLHRPDVVLMDLHLPGLGGIAATERITRDHPGTAVLALTMLDDEPNVRAALRAGARGYLVKDSSLDDIVRAVHTVAAGQVLLSGAIAAHALNTPARTPYGLTTRELQLARLLLRGSTPTQMAAQLAISPKTVRNHLSNLYLKLGVEDRAAAILLLQHHPNL